MTPNSSEVLYHVSVTADGKVFSGGVPGGSSSLVKMSWFHLCASHQATSSHLRLVAGLDDVVVEALLSKETRSRVSIRGPGALVILKAMHRLEGANPHDMVGLRLWVDRDRVITVREREIDAIAEIKMLIEGGIGPKSTGEFLTGLFEEIYAEIEPHIEGLEDSVAEMDEQVSQGVIDQACASLAAIGHSGIAFLRHLSPQKSVLDTLCGSGLELLSQRDVERMVESRDQLTRLLEALHEVRDRGAIINEQISRIQDIELNRAVYKFSLAATIFLPLSFITGLFGVNLGGLPGSTNDASFWILSAACLVFLTLSILASRKRRLL